MKQLRMVIAEDDADLREVLVRHFRDTGFAVFAVGDGREGVARVSQVRPHVIVLDLRMPVLDGEAMMKELQQRHAWMEHIPLVVVTNLSTFDAPSSVLRKQRHARYITKSNVALEEVSRAVHELLQESDEVYMVQAHDDSEAHSDH